MRFLAGILFTGLLMVMPVGGVQAATACGVSAAKSAAPASNYRERITRAWQPRKSGLGARLRKSSRLNPPAQNTRCATKKRPTEDERLKGQPYLTPGLFGPRKQISIQPGGTIRRGFGSFNP